MGGGKVHKTAGAGHAALHKPRHKQADLPTIASTTRAEPVVDGSERQRARALAAAPLTRGARPTLFSDAASVVFGSKRPSLQQLGNDWGAGQAEKLRGEIFQMKKFQFRDAEIAGGLNISVIVDGSGKPTDVKASFSVGVHNDPSFIDAVRQKVAASQFPPTPDGKPGVYDFSVHLKRTM